MHAMRITVVACLLVLASCAPRAGAPQASSTLPPDWTIHDAAGLRIAAPSAWSGPEVLPARDASGGPREWIVYRDASGLETVSLMTWRDATASAIAAAQYQGGLPQGPAPLQQTVVDGTSARTVFVVTGYAQWNDSNGGGSYECRHVFVQVDPRLVADVIACGAHVRGSATPTPWRHARS